MTKLVVAVLASAWVLLAACGSGSHMDSIRTFGIRQRTSREWGPRDRSTRHVLQVLTEDHRGLGKREYCRTR